jgi:hypothetical protein
MVIPPAFLDDDSSDEEETAVDADDTGWDLTTQLPAPPRPCRCDEHKYGHRPGNDAVLYAGPDAVLLMINSAIRDGRYEDIPADFDRVQHGVHARFDAAERQFARALQPAVRAWHRLNDARTAAAA